VASWSFLTNHADFMISSPLMGRSHQGWDPAPGQVRHNQAALRVARAD
jgi:hypothetical protein